jgi:C1A family cysteine protease
MDENRNAWYGCLPDVLNFNDFPLSLPRLTSPAPAVMDLRQWMPPVMDQGPIGSCTAHGVTAAARYHIIKRGTTYDFPMSRLQLYYDSRALEGSIHSDSGAQIRDVIKTLSKKGVGHEELWPYHPDKFQTKPPDEVYADAAQYTALTYERVRVSASDIALTLSHGYPVIIGISVYESFEAVGRNGLVPMPRKGETLAGGHCMLVVGRGQVPGHFTVRNSWGVDWGDHGDCYIPEAYLGSSEYGADYWHINLFGSGFEQKAGTA